MRRFRLDITVRGLVHIGNGQQYGKKDYFAKEGKVAVLDVRKFASLLTPSQMSRYCGFLEDGKDRFGLQGFLGRMENADLLNLARRSISYQIDSPIATARRGSIQYHDVFQFVKDPYGNPYVPGSSVKGMLRTAILLCMVLNEDELRSIGERSLGKRTKADFALNGKSFWKEAPNPSDGSIINDVMKYISVSDSAPLSTANLVFAKKFDKFSKDDPVDHKSSRGKSVSLEGNELDVYRECLRPGTVISVDVSVDERIDEYLFDFPLDAQGLSRVLKRSFDFYSKRFLSHFEDRADVVPAKADSADGACRYIFPTGLLAGKRCRNKAIGDTGFCRTHQGQSASVLSDSGTICYLGGGIDFMSKTVTSALFYDEWDAVRAIAEILYFQFPTRVDRREHPGLYGAVGGAGFEPHDFKSRRGGRIKKTKEDHRHWRDEEIGVSPHTMKWGTVGRDRYPMGKCSIVVRGL